MLYLKCDDCRAVLPQLPPASFDCAIVDPPYGQTSLPWDKPVPGWPQLVRQLIKPTGSMWVFGTLRHFMKYAGEFDGWKMSHDIVWEKQNGAGFFNDRFRTVHEVVAHFYRDDVLWRDVYKCPLFSNDATARTVRRKQTPAHWTGERNPTHYVSEDGGPRLLRSVIYARNEHGRATHPTQKPVDILDLLLRYSCPPGGYVLDPFAGTGSTGLAAQAYGCNAVLVEANPDYAAEARARCFLETPSCKP